MKLRDFLFEDPGYAPSVAAMANWPSPYAGGSTPIETPLSGQPMHDMQGYDQYTAMRRRGVLGCEDSIIDEAKAYKAKDRQGNVHPVDVVKDKEQGDYVATVRGGRYRKMASGNERQPIIALGTGATPELAVKDAGKKLRYESLDEAAPAKLKATVLRMVAALDTAKRSGSTKREQAAYEKLMAFTQDNGINFDNALAGARKHLNKKNPIGRSMSGFESLDEASPAKIKATVLRMVSAIDTAKRSGNLKKEQAAHEKLMVFTRENGINFENALTGARKHLNKKNPIGRSMSGFESVEERKLKPDYKPEGRDASVLTRLENGKSPGVAPEGKGYCFQCANGTLHAFKFKNDAARWLKADERNVTRSWFGDPIAPNRKFRIRVRDRYTKRDEDAHMAAHQFVEEGSIDFAGLLSDDDTRAGWRANIAMAIYDTKQEKGETAHEWRQRCAERFLDILAMPVESEVMGFGDFLARRSDEVAEPPSSFPV